MLGIRYRNAYRLRPKLILVMQEREDQRVPEDRIEINEAYPGGERSSGKARRESEKKVPFVVAIQTTKGGYPMSVVLTDVKASSQKK